MNYYEDFPMLNKNIVYFDNVSTTYKPKSVINSLIDYNVNYTATSCGGYSTSVKVKNEIEKTRECVQKFINAKYKEEIIFTTSVTDSLNKVVNDFFSNILSKDDVVLVSKNEYSSNILPWKKLSLKKKIKVDYIPLENNKITLENLKNKINDKTKVIFLAHISIFGDIRDMKKIIEYAHNKNIYVVIDGSLSVPHIKTDVQDLDADFLTFSAHKMCGPTGVGVLYGKYELLKKMISFNVESGIYNDYTDDKIKLSNIPHSFEVGTLNINGIISFKEAIKYIEKVGMENIERSEKYLRKYLIKELEKIEYVKILNKEVTSPIVIINIKNMTDEEVVLYLNSNGICVGNCMCFTEKAVRISLYFYNTYEEIDYLIYVLKNKKDLYKF